MRKLLTNLKFIFIPGYWTMNHPYSTAWDELLNQLMADYRFEYVNEFVAKFGPVMLWIQNHPYASFIPSDPSGCYFRASRETIRLARKKLKSDIGYYPSTTPVEANLNTSRLTKIRRVVEQYKGVS